MQPFCIFTRTCEHPETLQCFWLLQSLPQCTQHAAHASLMLFRRGGQAVCFKKVSKGNTVFVGKQVVGTKATGVCVVFCVAAKYSSIFA